MRKKALILALIFVLALPLVAAAGDYTDTDVQRGYDPAQGDEFRFDNVPVMPVSAKTISFDETSSVQTESLGIAPKEGVLMATYVDVISAFDNAGDIQVGNSSTIDAYVGTGDFDSTSTGGTWIAASQSSNLGSDTEILVKHEMGTASASSGEARITILWLIPPE